MRTTVAAAPDWQPRLPRRYRRTLQDRCPAAAGKEVAAMLAAADRRGYLLLPWGDHRSGFPRSGSLSLRLFNTWWRYCKERSLPFVTVAVRWDGRALVHYDLFCLSPLECHSAALAAALDAVFDTYAPERERPLQTPACGTRKTTFYVSGVLGWISFYTADPRPLALTLQALHCLLPWDPVPRRSKLWHEGWRTGR